MKMMRIKIARDLSHKLNLSSAALLSYKTPADDKFLVVRNMPSTILIIRIILITHNNLKWWFIIFPYVLSFSIFQIVTYL